MPYLWGAAALILIISVGIVLLRKNAAKKLLAQGNYLLLAVGVEGNTGYYYRDLRGRASFWVPTAGADARQVRLASLHQLVRTREYRGAGTVSPVKETGDLSSQAAYVREAYQQHSQTAI